MFLSDKFRWLAGVRMDHFDILEKVVFSPRTTFMFKPAAAHTFRVSYNRAYRAPSLVNNFLDVTILNQVNLGLINPALNGRIYTFPILAQGNQALTQQTLDAYELGYSGVINERVSVSLAWYYNEMKDDIYFTQTGSYSSGRVPPAWPLQPVVLDLLIAGNAFGPGLGLPSGFSYLNLGDVKMQGIEAGVDAAVTRHVSAYANYSWQSDPDSAIPPSELNLPPKHRVNAGFGFNVSRFIGTLDVNYQSEAFWQDVLDARYSGWTDSFSLVNASFGIRLAKNKALAQIKVNNLLNEEVQQHVFGDVIKRSVVAELRVTF
jgi:iron complex outermembrane receptor protein